MVFSLSWLLWTGFPKPCHLPPPGIPTALLTAETLFADVFWHYRSPEDISSNRGPQFISRVWKALMEQLGVTFTLTSGFHPMFNVCPRSVSTKSLEAPAVPLDIEGGVGSAYNPTPAKKGGRKQAPVKSANVTAGDPRRCPAVSHHCCFHPSSTPIAFPAPSHTPLPPAGSFERHDPSLLPRLLRPGRSINRRHAAARLSSARLGSEVESLSDRPD
ncbi:hypothetical protein DPEC_G00176210 [Dallia pectoralis]|uniref:Uncharacterized protein n=1 Tax=Dallia pectoralis TaxID=75939 RepID=A0ACC2GEY7_DALPE|nr:hypothetical protein DPEC_G00176210 [Dallia pectoralis]